MQGILRSKEPIDDEIYIYVGNDDKVSLKDICVTPRFCLNPNQIKVFNLWPLHLII